jgi:hypothetical protein
VLVAVIFPVEVIVDAVTVEEETVPVAEIFELDFILPLTSSFAVGLGTPIPTLPVVAVVILLVLEVALNGFRAVQLDEMVS